MPVFARLQQLKWERDPPAGAVDELRDSTIEVLLRKSDLQGSLQVLLGQEAHRRARRQS